MSGENDSKRPDDLNDATRQPVSQDPPSPDDAQLQAEAEAYAKSDADYAFFTEEAQHEDGAIAPPTLEEALLTLESWSDPARAAKLQAQHGGECRYLGTPAVGLDDSASMWREALAPEPRLELAKGLWSSQIFEARIVAAKLLSQARMRPDDAAWETVKDWIADCDSFALTDAVSRAGSKRLQAKPQRLEDIAPWLEAESPWPKVAMFTMTRPWAKLRNPKPEDNAAQDMVLGWAFALATGTRGPVARAISLWLIDLARFQQERVEDWLTTTPELSRQIRRETENALRKGQTGA
ncbi:DNA alkylation repair protein [Rhodobacteraceae bacterium]|nr:DNA alkylation repair protein [Paracoccaceae bacterium]